ncbi:MULTISPECIES: DUF3379 family protein [Pseudoalteromonas]|uniref:DUF3379 domain-containing protein n=1 Tax=Pseudoalteromonas amylolytica TaxID=1859457 RepID=A0A1S1MVE9_9GAMM|nr:MULTISPECIES: DUF3379 family protein [Pseudoalteromonas]OHU87635.1 hypothetical protein BFC16_09315 [Pseudoalteromonas sp. JW3]OHU91077.1 hypothetical protein BET10_09430 [Pseudoalteromonas amylolytica]
MDELEFRRRLFADPNDKDVAQEAANNAEQNALLEELQAFDAQIAKALDVEVPAGLAERILANQQADNKHNKVVKKSWFRSYRTPFATAASATFALGLYFMSATQAPLLAGEHALAHVRHEQIAFKGQDEIALQTVNDKLSLFGARLETLPGKVTYATFCNFKGQKSLHLVFQSEHGPMTVFIVPLSGKNSLGGDGQFADDRYNGVVGQDNHGATVLVANIGSPVEQYQKDVSNALRWQ